MMAVGEETAAATATTAVVATEIAGGDVTLAQSPPAALAADSDDGEDAGLASQSSDTAEPAKKIDFTPADFFFGSTLGEGAFARVVHARSKKTQKEFAIKIMDKVHIKRENKVKYVMMERTILAMVKHPFIVKFHFSFQDQDHLYMCMELGQGGELLKLISTMKKENTDKGVENKACDTPMTRFYICEIVEALEYLHGMEIIHRDLKPENILISESGHIKVTDFGTAIICTEDNNTSRNSFVGTQDYVSPEVLSGEKVATKACDLWALGCMTYQMLSGTSPFQSGTEYLTFMAIQNHADGSKPLEFPETISATEAELIGQLLQGLDTDRLGAGDEASCNGYTALKSHPFFICSEEEAPLETTEDVDSTAPSSSSSKSWWGRLDNMVAPYKPDSSKLFADVPTSSMRDGAFDDWMFDNETPAEYLAGDCQLELGLGLGPAASSSDQWTIFLDAATNESMMSHGQVYKRVGLFSKKRHLLLTSAPRLLYVDGEKMEVKGEIPWTDEHPVRCFLINAKEFDVYCSLTGRTYHLSDDGGRGAQTWIDDIHNMVKKKNAASAPAS